MENCSFIYIFAKNKLNMKKYFLILLLMGGSSLLFSQNSKTTQDSNELIEKAKVLYHQKDYAASQSVLNDFIKLAQTKADADYQVFYQEALYYQSANAYELKKKNAKELLAQYAKKYPQTPHTSEVCYMLGRLSYEKKDYRQVLTWYSKINNTDLSSQKGETYLFTKAYAHLMCKQYKQASYIFETLDGVDEERSKDAAYYFAYCEMQLKHYSKAIPALKRLQSDVRYNETASLLLLQAYDQTNDTEVIDYGKKVINRFPRSKKLGEAYRIVGAHSYEKKNYEDAAKYLKLYASNTKKLDRNTLYQLGMACYKTKDYDAAPRYLAKVTKKEDKLSQNAYLYLGHCNLHNNNITNARLAFESAASTQFDPKLTEEALYNYSLATYESNAPFGETIQAMEDFIKRYPNSTRKSSIYYYMYQTFITGKDYQKAIDAINKIGKKDPTLINAKSNAYFQLGVEAYDAHNYENAIQLFNQSIHLYSHTNPTPQAYLWRGESYYKLNKNTEARQDLLKYTQLATHKTEKTAVREANYSIAYTYYNQKNLNEAKIWFEKYALQCEEDHQKNTNYADAQIRIADIYYVNRNFSKAKLAYAKVPQRSRVSDYALFQTAFINGLEKQFDNKIALLQNLIKTHRGSDYTDDARYEIGRSYIAKEEYQKAIDSYSLLIKKQSLSPLARKAALEIGMLYVNKDMTSQAIQAYKKVVERYPNSAEARVAIESMQSLYIELNNIDEYIAYRESIAGTSITKVAKSEADSLSFIAAERIYASGNYKQAAITLDKYIRKYCDNRTLNCITAQYYLAESYYQIDKKVEALQVFDIITQMNGNSNREDALLRASEIAYDLQDYVKASNYFDLLKVVASNQTNKSVALLGNLRCNFKLNQNEATIKAANELLKNASDESRIREAKYCRAKSYIAINQASKAVDDLKVLKENLRYEMGAEAKYLYAQYLFDTKQYDATEKEATDFIQKNTPHQYWMAKAFILLADVYTAKKDYFQARQYLNSLQKNYQAHDGIHKIINEHLSELDSIEAQEAQADKASVVADIQPNDTIVEDFQ